MANFLIISVKFLKNRLQNFLSPLGDFSVVFFFFTEIFISTLCFPSSYCEWKEALGFCRSFNKRQTEELFLHWLHLNSAHYGGKDEVKPEIWARLSHFYTAINDTFGRVSHNSLIIDQFEVNCTYQHILFSIALHEFNQQFLCFMLHIFFPSCIYSPIIPKHRPPSCYFPLLIS